MWERAGYFYEAVAAAMVLRAQDNGVAWATLLRSVNLERFRTPKR